MSEMRKGVDRSAQKDVGKKEASLTTQVSSTLPRSRSFQEARLQEAYDNGGVGPVFK